MKYTLFLWDQTECIRNEPRSSCWRGLRARDEPAAPIGIDRDNIFDTATEFQDFKDKFVVLYIYYSAKYSDEAFLPLFKFFMDKKLKIVT